MSDYNDGLLPTPCLRMDTHFWDEYESIEFGDGTGFIKAAPILAKVGALHEEIDRLRDESAELRELVRDMYEDTEGRCFECRSWEHFEHRGKPSECGNGECGFKRIADRMRELGVDV